MSRDRLTFSFLNGSRNVHRLPGLFGNLTASVVLVFLIGTIFLPAIARNRVIFGMLASTGYSSTFRPYTRASLLLPSTAASGSIDARSAAAAVLVTTCRWTLGR